MKYRVKIRTFYRDSINTLQSTIGEYEGKTPLDVIPQLTIAEPDKVVGLLIIPIDSNTGKEFPYDT